MDTATALLNGIAFIPVVALSALAFWRPNPVLFCLLSGLAMVTGLEAPDLLGTATTNVSLTIGISLVGYSLLCVAMTYRYMFAGEPRRGSE